MIRSGGNRTLKNKILGKTHIKTVSSILLERYILTKDKGKTEAPFFSPNSQTSEDWHRTSLIDRHLQRA